MGIARALDTQDNTPETPSKKLCRRISANMSISDIDDVLTGDLTVKGDDMPQTNVPLRPRAYQLEMFEAAMRDNVIVSVSPSSPMI